MNDIKSEVYARLSDMGIAYRKADHAPAHSIEDCKVVEELLGASVPKNLFLTPRNQSAFYLLIVRGNAEFRTSDISKQIGSSRLSFGSPEKLMEMLRTRPGAISPMGLMFDKSHSVRLLVDSALLAQREMAFHPCDNTASLAMSGADFFGKYLPAIGFEPTFIEIHNFIDSTSGTD